jgi:hypothetical protein
MDNFFLKTLCKGIDPEYILDELDNNDLVILSLSINPRKTRSKISAKRLCGLILLKIRPSYVYISLVCGMVGLGKSLLNIVEKIAAVRKINKIKLHSVDNALGFYIKHNFKFDRGGEVYTLGEDDDDLKPKTIAVTPPKYDLNGNKIDIGYIHRETRCRYKYSWILVEENGLRRWKLLKPSYLNLNKFKPDIKKYLLTRKPNLIYKRDLKKKGRSKNI